MTRDTRIQIIAALILVGCLVASTGLTTALSGLAGRSKLVYTDTAEEGQTWEVSAGIAMGAFRGIFVNWLWMRANEMKEDGKYYEAIELSRAITRLQPRFPRVWVFHAWNLAYNISVATQTADERWNWVMAGIRLLRDEAIPANPNDLLLHKELGWIYSHKIGGWTDDANQYYKRRHAAEWTVVLGPPPAREPADRDRDYAIKKYADWLQTFADAPTTLEEMARVEPTTTQLVERLVAINVKPDLSLLDRYETYTHLIKGYGGAAAKRNPGPFLGPVAALIEDPAYAKAWPVLLRYVRRQVLTDRYRMEPDRMIRYTHRFGPIDWRTPAAHALYWSSRGVETSQSRRYEGNKRDFDFINSDRVTVQAIQDLFRYGDLYFDFAAFRLSQSSTAMLFAVPNPAFVQSYGDILDDAASRSWVDNPYDRGYRPMAAGYENFLRDAVCFFFARGDRRSAEQWYQRLRTWEGININDPLRRVELSAPLDDFVSRELLDRIGTPNVAVAQVNGALLGAYTAGLLAGDMDIFAAQFEYASRFHKAFFEKQFRTTNVDRGSARMEMMPSDFREAAGVVFAQFVMSLTPEAAENVYDRASNDLRLYAYGVLEARFRQEMEAIAKAEGTRPFEAVFPPPPGLEAFRADQQRKLDAAKAREQGAELK
ncbi:MAG: hypothetical protein IPM33_04055 [Phycisphaerales bacterium]|nr:hypothetical protein [Phycisphaerales bacterium]